MQNSWFKAFQNVGFIFFNESPLKIMNNAICFILNTLFVLKIFNFFGHVGDQIDKKVTLNFKIYDVANWLTNN